ncbi:MAG: prepilin-type N-terminal cleavage/methylation domain-containing protein [Luteolibacter sp.]|jgi:prepilin-type N-terminal cleavage/methylation domain-containing protein|nr:prepilin-type N-terminal cleavage/methylation domain-containing protein [Luteolibacter sp.]
MKIHRTSLSKRGFTLLELMVAMAITSIIVTVLVSITSIAIDTWNRSRSELRAARQAKAFVDTMARDFESLVTRRGNDSEWLSAASEPPALSSNAATLVFFSAATDRYNGEIGKTGVDLGGDVSCVGYKLERKDPIEGGATGEFQTFVLNRYLVDPKPTFEKLLGKTEIGNLFTTTYGTQLSEEENFICENVFQFTVTFYVEVAPATGSTSSQPDIKQISIGTAGGDKKTKFSIKGTGIATLPADPALTAGRITSVGISLTVLSDAGIDLLRKSSSRASDAAWLAKNSYQYSKLIQVPGM